MMLKKGDTKTELRHSKRRKLIRWTMHKWI